MIRNKNELLNYDDLNLLKQIEPSENKISQYCQNHLVYNYFTYVISTLYRENNLWSNYSLEILYNQALESLINNMPKYKDLKFNKINNLLKSNYYIKIKNKNPIIIEEIKS